MVVHSDVQYMRYPTNVLMFFHEHVVLAPRSDLFHSLLSLSYVDRKDAGAYQKKIAHEMSVCVIGMDARFGANVARWFAQTRVGHLMLIGRDIVQPQDDVRCLLLDDRIGEHCARIAAQHIEEYFPDTICQTRVDPYRHDIAEYDLVVCTSVDEKLQEHVRGIRPWNIVIPT